MIFIFSAARFSHITEPTGDSSFFNCNFHIIKLTLNDAFYLSFFFIFKVIYTVSSMRLLKGHQSCATAA